MSKDNREIVYESGDGVENVEQSVGEYDDIYEKGNHAIQEGEGKPAKEGSKAKKKKSDETISLGDKSERFTKIIDSLLEYEKNLMQMASIKAKNKELEASNDELHNRIQELEGLCRERSEEVERLKTDVEHREEVIGIVKADKDESAKEYKNALSVALKSYISDFEELKEMEMSTDIGLAISDTLQNVLNILEKNGIEITK